MKNLKILLAVLIATLCFVQPTFAVSKYNLYSRWYTNQGPPKEGLLTYFKNTTDVSTSGLILKDRSTRATHQAQPAGSVEFRGAQYATLASAVTLVGDFSISISLRASSLPEIKALVSGESYDNVIAINTSGNIFVRINNISQTITLSSVITTTTNIDAVISRSGTAVSYSDSRGATGSVDMGDSSNMVLDTIGDWGGTNNFIGNIWNITASDTTSGTLLDITMSYGEDANIISTVGPDATLVNGLTTDRVESSLFGDDSFNELGWSEGVTDNTDHRTGGIAIGVNLTETVSNDTVRVDTTGTGTSSDNRAIVIGDVATGTSNTLLKFTCTTAPTGIAAKITNGGSYVDVTIVEGLNELTADSVSGNAYIILLTAGTIVTDFIIEEYPQGKIPADPDNPAQDIYGNALTYPGRASKDANLYGWTMPWNGVAYATLDEAVTLSGDFNILFDITIDDLLGSSSRPLFSGNTATEGIFFIKSTGIPAAYINGTNYDFDDFVVLIDTRYIGELKRVGTNLSLTLNDVSQTLSATTHDFIIRYLLKWSAVQFSGTVPYIKLYNASNQLTNHWPIEGRNNVDDEQITIYDVIDTVEYPANNATVASGTVPLFTSPFGGDGGSYVENLLPYSEPTEAGDLDNLTEVTVATSSGGLADYVEDSVVFDDNSIVRAAYIDADNSATLRMFSIYVEMDDGSTPIVTQASTGDDFNIVMNSANSGVTITSIINVSGNVYKVTGTRSSTGGAAGYGVLKLTGHSSKTFKVSRYHLTESDGSYIRTDATAIPLTLIPSGGSYLAEKGGLTGVADGVEVATNGDASDATYTDSSVHALVGFVNSGTHNATNKVTIEGGQFRFISDGAGVGIVADQPIVSGQSYQYYINITSVTAGSIRLATGSNTVALISGINTGTIVGDSTNIYLYRNATPANITFDNLSIQKITQDIIPYGASTEPNTFDGVFDAPANVFQVEQVEATLAVQEADATSIWIDKTTGATKLVDPYDIPANTDDNIFKGDKATLIYEEALTGHNLIKAERFVD